MEEQRSYYAIIPANVRYDKELPANAKLLYGEITALCNERGYCWATNDYFSNLYGVSKTSISKWIAALINRGYIFSEIVYKEGTKEILNRYLKLVKDPIEEKLNRGIEEKLKDNNTLINNTINNNKERKKENKKSAYDEIINEMVKDPDIKEGIYEFIKMRKLMKKPMTDRALKQLIGKLNTLSTNKQEQIQILDNSIINNWASVYPLKNENFSKKGRKEIVPDWMNKEYKKQELDEEELKEMKELIKPLFSEEQEEELNKMYGVKQDPELAARAKALQERLKNNN